MGCGFFDYKYFIENYNGEDFNGIMHVVYILICLIGIPMLIRHYRQKGDEDITRLMRFSAVLLIVEEITKITWESYWDIVSGHGFNAGGILPLETCSLFIYCLAAAGFGKGKVRECALAWMASIGILGGMSYIVVTNVLKWYPFFTYGAFHSMIFHFMMVFIGLLIPFSNYHLFRKKDMLQGYVPQLLLAVVVIPLDYLMDWDYMLLHYAGGVPLIENLADKFTALGMPWLTTLVMLVVYFLLGSLIIAINIHFQNKAIARENKGSLDLA
jgi:hypothetical protein